MKRNEIKELLKIASLNNSNNELEFEIFNLIYELCIDRDYNVDAFIGICEESSLCEQQKFIHLVAMQDDEILDLVYEFHKTFSETNFCKDEFKSKFELQLLENTFEISL